MTMENDLILQNFDEGSDGMLPTTSCSLPSSSGISSLPLPCSTGDDGQPMRLLPLRRHPAPVLPLVGRSARAAKDADKIGGRNLSEVFLKGHGGILPQKKKCAMHKLGLASGLQCTQSMRMTTPADYDTAIATAMRSMQPGPAFNLTINALRDGRNKAEARMAKQELKALIKSEFVKASAK